MARFPGSAVSLMSTNSTFLYFVSYSNQILKDKSPKGLIMKQMTDSHLSPRLFRGLNAREDYALSAQRNT